MMHGGERSMHNSIPLFCFVNEVSCFAGAPKTQAFHNALIVDSKQHRAVDIGVEERSHVLDSVTEERFAVKFSDFELQVLMLIPKLGTMVVGVWKRAYIHIYTL
jgi:hypothetical protein